MSDVLKLQEEEDAPDTGAEEKNSNVSYVACAASNVSLLLCVGF